MTSDSSLRTFIAIPADCPVPLARAVKELGQLGSAFRTVSPRDLHCTLKFLGDTPVEIADSIGAELVKSLAGFPRFRAELQGVGVFPHVQRPTVVWAGLVAPELADLQSRVETLAAGFGFAAEERPFRPHVTLARIRHRPPRELQRLLHEHAQTSWGEIDIESVVLFRSTRKPTGAQYESLATARLGS